MRAERIKRSERYLLDGYVCRLILFLFHLLPVLMVRFLSLSLLQQLFTRRRARRLEVTWHLYGYKRRSGWAPHWRPKISKAKRCMVESAGGRERNGAPTVLHFLNSLLFLICCSGGWPAARLVAIPSGVIRVRIALATWKETSRAEDGGGGGGSRCHHQDSSTTTAS